MDIYGNDLTYNQIMHASTCVHDEPSLPAK